MIILRSKSFADYLDELATKPNGQKLIEDALSDRNACTLPQDPNGFTELDKTKPKTEKSLKGSQRGNRVRNVPKNTAKYIAVGGAALLAGYGAKKVIDKKKKAKKDSKEKES